MLISVHSKNPKGREGTVNPLGPLSRQQTCAPVSAVLSCLSHALLVVEQVAPLLTGTCSQPQGVPSVSMLECIVCGSTLPFTQCLFQVASWVRCVI